MREVQEYVQHYVAQLSGPDGDDAWHSLVEVGPAALSEVTRALEATSDPAVKEALIRAVSQWRSPEALPLLSRLLQDGDARLWKAALDGLITIGGTAALQALRTAKGLAAPDRQAWIEEAIGQLRDSDQPG